MIEAWNDLCLSLSLSNFPFDDAPSASIERERRRRMDVVESERKKNGFSRSYSDAVAAMRMCVGCKCGGGERKWLAHGLAGSVISRRATRAAFRRPLIHGTVIRLFLNSGEQRRVPARIGYIGRSFLRTSGKYSMFNILFNIRDT